MNEFRQDFFTKGWVLIAGNRGQRPTDFGQVPATPIDLLEISDACSFCPGKEDQTPGEILRYVKEGKWVVRVIPNKYTAVAHEYENSAHEFYLSRAGTGDHELVITRYHNQPTALQSEALIDLTLQAYIQRMTELESHEEIRYVHIIQNHGAPAGASIVHPHSQIFAIPFLPDRIKDELTATKQYHDLHGSCIYCDMIQHEIRTKRRVVLETDDYLVMCPFASRVPFQIRILPKAHKSRFNDLTISQRKALAAVMKESFKRMYDRLKNPSYNYYIHTLPADRDVLIKEIAKTDSYHWHMVILPRMNVWAGFELGTEVYVNTMPPEEAAEFLRLP